jgi:hypothetical protein
MHIQSYEADECSFSCFLASRFFLKGDRGQYQAPCQTRCGHWCRSLPSRKEEAWRCLKPIGLYLGKFRNLSILAYIKQLSFGSRMHKLTKCYKTVDWWCCSYAYWEVFWSLKPENLANYHVINCWLNYILLHLMNCSFRGVSMKMHSVLWLRGLDSRVPNPGYSLHYLHTECNNLIPQPWSQMLCRLQQINCTIDAQTHFVSCMCTLHS